MRISLEGCPKWQIGKTSILQELERMGHVIHWMQDDDLGEWLERFQQDKNRWAFGLQMKVLAGYQRAPRHAIMKNSPLSCRYVFAQLYHNLGYISAKEWDLFKAYYDLTQWEPDVIVYLETPEVDGQVLSNDPALASKLEFQYANMLKYFSRECIKVKLHGNESAVDVAHQIISHLSSRGFKLGELQK